MKSVISSFVCLFLICLCSCTKGDEQTFFKFPLTDVSPCVIEDLLMDGRFVTSSSVPFCQVWDSLIISMERRDGDYMFYLSHLSDDSVIGKFGHKGRAENEIISCLPIFEIYVDATGYTCVDLFSFNDGRLLKLNLDKSMQTGRDCYEYIDTLISETGYYPFTSLFRIDEQKIIVNNSKYSKSDFEPPVYEMYNLETGAFLREYPVFNTVEYDSGNELYSSVAYTQTEDIISPNKEKLAFTMCYMPIYGILNIDTGSVEVFRLKQHTSFSYTKQILHFKSLAADEMCIYALYSGQKAGMNDKSKYFLYVMDWDGNMIHRYKINKSCSFLRIDNGRLYFISSDGSIDYVDIKKIR